MTLNSLRFYLNKIVFTTGLHLRYVPNIDERLGSFVGITIVRK